jgi:hypothetical protein
MRFARALLASFGAGTCLVLAGTLAMTTLSTVVAFSGLPGLRAGGADTTPPAVLAAAGPGAGTADVVPAPVALARPAAPSRTTTATTRTRRASALRVATGGAVAATQTAGSVVPQAGPNTTTPAPTPSAASGGGSGSLPKAVVSPGAKARPSPAVTAPSGGPLRDVGTTAGGIVAGVGGGLAETVRPVSPPAATIVGDTTKAAGDTVEAATGTVAR